MLVKKTQKGYIIKLSRGEKVIETLTQFCGEHDIKSGIFHGIGAVNNVEMGYYDLAKREYFFKRYLEAMEVVSMTGNVALVEDKPFLHVHTVLSDTDNHAYGGHVKEAEVAVTLEVYFTDYEVSLERTLDDDVGLKLLDL